MVELYIVRGEQRLRSSQGLQLIFPLCSQDADSRMEVEVSPVYSPGGVLAQTSSGNTCKARELVENQLIARDTEPRNEGCEATYIQQVLQLRISGPLAQAKPWAAQWECSGRRGRMKSDMEKCSIWGDTRWGQVYPGKDLWIDPKHRLIRKLEWGDLHSKGQSVFTNSSTWWQKAKESVSYTVNVC